LKKSKEISVTQIKPYWRNPRKNEKAVEAVAASLEEFDFYQPLVLDKDNVIIVGHTRYKAAKHIGMKKVPCIIADDLNEDQVRRLRIIDNKTSELADWDMGLLTQELREVLDIDAFQIYFGKQDLSKILDASVGVNKAAITGEQIADRGKELADKFTNGDQDRRVEILDITCPHCNETFGVDRDYVIEQLGVDDE
jgi:hypothetical protein